MWISLFSLLSKVFSKQTLTFACLPNPQSLVLQLPYSDSPIYTNLASILPLSSLIEFIDSVTKLHMYELSGRDITWNWPITPAGARLLLERSKPENNIERKHACVLDGGKRLPDLQCVDMRWGDHYSCANRFTVRQCCALAPLHEEFGDTAQDRYRPQYLEVVRVFAASSIPPPSCCHLHKLRHSISSKPGFKWFIILLCGWIMWAAAVVLSALNTSFLALAYLVTLPLTGLLVRALFGHRPRRLAKRSSSPWRRMVLVAENYNCTKWTAVWGDSDIVDSLLNKPFLAAESKRKLPPGYQNLLRSILRVIIAVQWGLVVAASALQGWDALLISGSIIVCTCTSAFIYGADESVASWLRTNDIAIEKVRVAFSGRRAMLSALVAVNPDSSTQWIDPILAPSNDRTAWEGALRGAREGKDPEGKQGWVHSIKEGLVAASRVEQWLSKPSNKMIVAPDASYDVSTTKHADLDPGDTEVEICGPSELTIRSDRRSSSQRCRRQPVPEAYSTMFQEPNVTFN